MDNIFEIKDKNGRTIALRKKEWKHIVWYHPDVAKNIDWIKGAIADPVQMREDVENEKVYLYQKWYKEQGEYLIVIVKHLNGGGFIITSYWSKNLKR